MAEFLSGPVSHEEARRLIEAKPVVTREVFDRMLPEVRQRAFTITGVESANVMQDVRDRIAQLPQGADWDEVKRSVADQASPWLANPDDPDAMDKALSRSMRRAEVLMRHHGFQAYQATQHEVMQATVEDFPYWQYQTVGDGNVRDSHAALDGVTLPANHPFWDRHYPPWDWGCRCQVVPVSRRDYERVQGGQARGRTLTPEQENLLMERGQLDDGSGHLTDVRAPVEQETTEEGKRKAFQWNPGDMRMPMEDVQVRYDDETWESFRRWAQRTVVGQGTRSIMDWLSGA